MPWIDTDPKEARVVEVKDTITFGPAYVLEIGGERLSVCYWTSDIEGRISQMAEYDRLYSDPDFQWKIWGDQ